MREKLLAVCDKDERYLQGMQEYFQRKGTADFQIVTFTALEQVISYSQNNNITKSIKNRHCSKIACNADFPLFYAVSKDFKRQEKSLQTTRDKKWLVTN